MAVSGRLRRLLSRESKKLNLLSLDLGYGYEGPGPIMHGVGIFILDDEAKPIAALGVNVYGAPILGLRGKNGTATLAAGSSTPSDESPTLLLKNNTSRAQVSVDERGNLGAQLRLTSLYSSNQETDIELKTEETIGPYLSLTFTDHSSEIQNDIRLNAFPGYPSLNLSSGKEVYRESRNGRKLSKAEISKRAEAQASIGLDAASSGPSLSIKDQNGNLRTVLGTTQLKDSRTGSVETRAPSSLVLFGENGKVIWQVP